MKIKKFYLCKYLGQELVPYCKINIKKGMVISCLGLSTGKCSCYKKIK